MRRTGSNTYRHHKIIIEAGALDLAQEKRITPTFAEAPPEEVPEVPTDEEDIEEKREKKKEKKHGGFWSKK